MLEIRCTSFIIPRCFPLFLRASYPKLRRWWVTMLRILKAFSRSPFCKLTMSSYFLLQLWNTFNHNFSPRISYSLKCPVLLRLLPLVLFSFTIPTFKNQHEAVLFHCPLIIQHNDSRLYYNVLSSDFLISIFTHLAICFSLNSLISRLLTWFINFLSHCDRKLNDSSTHTHKKKQPQFPLKIYSKIFN